jgi:hypothetical protein
VALAQVALHVQVVLVLVQDRAVHLAPVLLVQAVHLAQPALASAARVQAAHQVLVLLEPVLREVVQVLAVVAVVVLAPQAHLERVARKTRAASPSALREKNLSRDLHLASVVLWCHAAMATRLFASVADPRFRTSPTRLGLTPVS